MPSQKTCSARINPIPALLIKRKPNVTYTGWRGTGSESNSLKPIKLARAMEGFDSEGFVEDLESYGGWRCGHCSVREAMELRRQAEDQEKFRRKIEEEMKRGKPSLATRERHDYFKRSDVVRAYKMLLVKLRFYEEMGGAKDKSCEEANWLKCSYGEESEQLVENGSIVKHLWRRIKWYDYHWNPSGPYAPKVYDREWYHYDEAGILDVTSFEDVRKAIRDGRLDKIIKEHDRYIKETGCEIYNL